MGTTTLKGVPTAKVPTSPRDLRSSGKMVAGATVGVLLLFLAVGIALTVEENGTRRIPFLGGQINRGRNAFVRGGNGAAAHDRFGTPVVA